MILKQHILRIKGDSILRMIVKYVKVVGKKLKEISVSRGVYLGVT
jgi:hypothetical protein